MKSIGTILKELLNDKGIAQKELSKKTEISETTISLVLNCIVNPSEHTLNMICSILKIPIPVVYFLSLDEQDIPDEKREIFITIVKPIMKEIFKIK